MASSVVQTETYLLACSRYIELNPVRARMCLKPGNDPWSSYSSRTGKGESSEWLDIDPCFLSLGSDPCERQERYASFVKQAVSETEARLIREALQRGQLTGNDRFVDEVKRIAGLRIERRGQGRPRKLDK
jgi:putative transposase